MWLYYDILNRSVCLSIPSCSTYMIHDFGRGGLFVQTMELSVEEIVAKNITFAIPLGFKNTHFTYNAESFYFRFSYFMLNELHSLNIK